MGIAGIRVQETVPDTFLEQASEIRVMDLTPGQLRERLKLGKVYLGERAATAAEHFFREGNLQALREMALRYAARKVDAEKREYMRHHRIPGPWRAGERFLVTSHGTPIPEEEQGRIFERFHRGAKAGAGGLGLGLPIARQFAALIGGSLTLASSDEEKTVFALDFPG
jgi:K+-sensing histidine kinase KdpD